MTNTTSRNTMTDNERELIKLLSVGGDMFTFITKAMSCITHFGDDFINAVKPCLAQGNATELTAIVDTYTALLPKGDRI